MQSVLSLVILLTQALAEGNFVQIPVSVERVTSAGSAKTTKNTKVDELPSSMRGSIYEYFVEFELGSPAQTNKALLDTGSADIWVYGPESSGAPYTYDANASTSAHYVNSDFSIHYADSSSSAGDYYKDDVHVGNVTLPVQFAVDSSKFNRYGKFGLAHPSIESDSHKYSNFPARLKEEGLIGVNAYSLFLDDLDASTGSLLFGAIDRSSFYGPLHIVNTTKQDSFYVDVEVDGHRFTAEPDSGTTYSYIPSDLLAAFAQSVNAVWTGSKYVTKNKPSNATFTYNFSGASITVSTDELFVADDDGFELTIYPNTQTNGMNLLGDSFLRSAYVVYHLDGGYLAIAQARYDKNKPDIVPIEEDGIPGAVDTR